MPAAIQLKDTHECGLGAISSKLGIYIYLDLDIVGMAQLVLPLPLLLHLHLPPSQWAPCPVHIFFMLRILTSTAFLSLRDLASTGFRSRFSVFSRNLECGLADFYGQYSSRDLHVMVARVPWVTDGCHMHAQPTKPRM